MKNIVVVDDEQYICNIIREALDEFPDCRVHNFIHPEEAEGFITSTSIDLVLTDLVMGNYSGVQILETALSHHPDAVVILMTGYPTVKTAISVLKKGGYDYLVKPFKLEDLKSTIERGLEHQRLKRENLELRSQLELMRVTDAMARGTRLQPLLNLIIESATKALPSASASILLRDRHTGEYSLQCQSDGEKSADIAAFLRGQSISVPRAEGKEPSITNLELPENGVPYRRSFISCPMIFKGETAGLLNVTCSDRFNYVSPGQLRLITLFASAGAFAVETNFLDRNLQKSYMQTIRALANAVEARDRYTAGHTDRVLRIARVLARKMGWNAARLALLKTGCVLHDIGKIGVPDAILNKPSQLTDDERDIMRKHTEMGLKILGGIPFLEPVLPYIISHHERYDGNGYPYGLRGEDIPIEGRLLAVIDTFDAIMSDRPYRQGGEPQKAIDELILNRGTQFDPLIVDLFMEALNDGSINSRMIYGRSGVNDRLLSEKI